ncbi:hypothetical protein MMC07_005741 [Pseudocyphellaria aurata]|nr:hypothetical protein [Pseudocyphellaria aurata]
MTTQSTRLTVLISDGLVRAQNVGIATSYLNLVEYKKRHADSVSQAREEYDKDLARLILEDHAHSVVCGLHNTIALAHKDGLEGRRTKTGIMSHKIISEFDTDASILVHEIPFQKGVDEDLKALEDSIHRIEWKATVTGTE